MEECARTPGTVSALVTDLYELNMAGCYLHLGMDGPATFSLFVRRLPERRGFLVAAGLEDCLRFLENWAFADDELAYLADLGFAEEVLRGLAAMRFTGDVMAVAEGTVVFADEPLLEVTAPIAEAQLVESYLLNQVTFQTAIASKAARCRIAGRERVTLVDFSLRRTHGVEAADGVARASAIAGFTATSNVGAARRYGLTPAGTMAHSFIQAFPEEIDAFRAFASAHPEGTTFLVDTYDVMRGVDNAIRVIDEAGAARNAGIRLDSGDLDADSRAARARLDAAGLRGVRIFASGGLDEYDIARLVGAGAPIDAFGIGTKLGVSADAPSLDSAYKLVAYGDRPVLKLSPGKATWPSAKQVHRSDDLERDVLALRSEAPAAGQRPLLEPVLRRGRRLHPPDTLAAMRARFEHDLALLPARARALEDPEAPRVQISPRLDELADRLRRQLTGDESVVRRRVLPARR